MELILKRISDLPLQDASSLTGTELVLVGNNGVNVLVPLSAVFADAQSQLSNVANLSVVTLANIQDANFTNTYVTYDLLAQAVQSLGILLTQSQQQALLLHLINYNNPHRVTAEQVGLGNVANLPLLTQADLTANNYGNKYVTYNILQAACEALGFRDLSNVANYPPVSLSDIQNGVFGQTYLTYNLLSQAVQSLNIVLPPLLRSEFLAHLINFNNPHETTASQVGLGNVVNLPVLTQANITAGDTTLEAYVTYNLLSQALLSLGSTGILTAAQKTAFLAHLTDYNNPHQVTAAQVGLGNVANLLPISQPDITSVDNGNAPAEVYITYDMLAAANAALGYKTGYGITLNLTVPTINLTSVGIAFTITANNNIGLINTEFSINYKLSTSATYISAETLTFNNSLSYTAIITGLVSDQNYDIQVVMTNPNNNQFIVTSNIVQLTTLNGTQSDAAASFDIVGFGSISTTPFDSNSITGTDITFVNNGALATLDNAVCSIDPITQIAGQPNFVELQAKVAYRPFNLLQNQRLNTNAVIYPTASPANFPVSGDKFYLNIESNGTQALQTVTLGTDIDYQVDVALTDQAMAAFYPVPVCAHSSVIIGNYIYSFGGITNSSAHPNDEWISTIYRIPISPDGLLSGGWEAVGALPTTLGYMNVIVYDNYVYILGGIVNDYTASGTGGTANEDVGTNIVYMATIDSVYNLSSFTQVSTLPVSVYNQAATLIGNVIYLMGGIESLNTTTSQAVYSCTINSNGTLNSWVNINQNLPNGMAMVQSVVVNKNLYVFGINDTSSGSGEQFYSAVAPINSDNTLGAWQALPNPGFSLSGSPVIISINNYIYVIGGGSMNYVPNGANSNSIYRVLSQPNGSLTDSEVVGNIATSPELATGIIAGRYLYIIGGANTGGRDDVTQQVVRYTINTDNGLNVGVIDQPLATPLAYLTAEVYNGAIYVIGGVIEADTNTAPAGSTPTYNMIFTAENVVYWNILNGNKLSSWGSNTPLPIPIYAHCSILIGNIIYVFGGTTTGGVSISTVYAGTITGGIINWSNTNNDLPITINVAQAVIIGSYVYILGGNQGPGGRERGVYRAIINSDNTLGPWSEYASLPMQIGYQSNIVIGNYLYMFGGSTNAISSPLTNLLSNVGGWIYKGISYRAKITGNDLGEWMEFDNFNFYELPMAGDGNTLLINGNYLYSFGGYTSSNHLNGIYRATIYDNGNLSPWELVNTDDSELQNHQCGVTVGNRMYIIGGEGQQNPTEVVNSQSRVTYYVQSQSTVTPIGSNTLPNNIVGFYQADKRFISGAIGALDTALIPLTDQSSPTVVDGTIIHTLNPLDGGGAVLQLSISNLKKGDVVVEFKGDVFD